MYNKKTLLPRWSHISIIEVNGLKEIKLIGRQYTWANSLPDPTYENLDSGIEATPGSGNRMNRDISDHVPPLLKCGAPPQHCNSFRYEN
jgi:hypothetical protein